MSGGALGVDGTLALGANTMTVAQGATLAGFGWINGNTVINGVLNAGQLPNYSDLSNNNGGVLPAGIPLTGTSPGTLTFTGNVTLGAGADTRVNVDGNLQIPGGPRTYDKIIVQGAGNTFLANGVLTPVLRNIPGGTNIYTPSIGAQFPFLTVSGGASVTGSYSGLSQPAIGLPINARFDLIYAPTSLTLDVTPQSYLALAAMVPLNANQQALAAALDRVRPAAGPALSGPQATVFYALYQQQNVFGDATALAAISGEGQAATPGALLDAYAGFSDVIANRQSMLAMGIGDVQATLTPAIALSYANGAGPNVAALADAGGAFTALAPAGAAPKSPWTTWVRSMAAARGSVRPTVCPAETPRTAALRSGGTARSLPISWRAPRSATRTHPPTASPMRPGRRTPTRARSTPPGRPGRSSSTDDWRPAPRLQALREASPSPAKLRQSRTRPTAGAGWPPPTPAIGLI